LLKWDGAQGVALVIQPLTWEFGYVCAIPLVYRFGPGSRSWTSLLCSVDSSDSGDQ